MSINEVSKNERGAGKLLLLLGLVAIFVALSFFVDIEQATKDLLTWIETLGPLGVVAFIVIYVVATILFIPGSILTLGAGAVFGVVWGSVYVSIASTTGAGLSFLIGRYLAREAIAKKIEGNEKFAAVDRAVADEGWKIVFLTRLSPIFPFNLLNYAYGLTKVSFNNYLLASWVGMIPGTIMYVYLGFVAGDIAAIGLGERQRGGAEWALTIVGLLATIAVTVFVTKIARKALSKHVAEPLEA